MVMGSKIINFTSKGLTNEINKIFGLGIAKLTLF